MNTATLKKIPKDKGLYICASPHSDAYRRIDKVLNALGHIIFCPYSDNREDIFENEMKVQRIEALMACDVVIFLSGWQEDKWCIMEEKIAVYLGKICLKAF